MNFACILIRLYICIYYLYTFLTLLVKDIELLHLISMTLPSNIPAPVYNSVCALYSHTLLQYT